jgi:hypothetical protein
MRATRYEPLTSIDAQRIQKAVDRRPSLRRALHRHQVARAGHDDEARLGKQPRHPGVAFGPEGVRLSPSGS